MEICEGEEGSDRQCAQEASLSSGFSQTLNAVSPMQEGICLPCLQTEAFCDTLCITMLYIENGTARRTGS